MYLVDAEYIHFDLMLCKRTDFLQIVETLKYSLALYAAAVCSDIFFFRLFGVEHVFVTFGWLAICWTFFFLRSSIPSQQIQEMEKKKCTRELIWLCEFD